MSCVATGCEQQPECNVWVCPTGTQRSSFYAAQVTKRWIECSALVTAISLGRADLVLAVELPMDTWSPHSRWRASDKAATLFAHLLPATAVQQSGLHGAESYLQRLCQDLAAQGVDVAGSSADAFRWASFRSWPVLGCNLLEQQA
jgi:hypothetical protein